MSNFLVFNSQQPRKGTGSAPVNLTLGRLLLDYVNSSTKPVFYGGVLGHAYRTVLCQNKMEWVPAPLLADCPQSMAAIANFAQRSFFFTLFCSSVSTSLLPTSATSQRCTNYSAKTASRHRHTRALPCTQKTCERTRVHAGCVQQDRVDRSFALSNERVYIHRSITQ